MRVLISLTPRTQAGQDLDCSANSASTNFTNAVQNATKCTEVQRLMFCREPHRWAPIQQKVMDKRSTGQDINIYIISNTNKNINTMRAYGR